MEYWMKQKKTTGEIQELLKKLKPRQLKSFLNDNQSDMIDDKKAFYYYTALHQLKGENVVFTALEGLLDR